MDRKEHTFFSKWRKEQFFWVKTRIICLSENESEKEKNLCPGENWNYLSEWKLKYLSEWKYYLSEWKLKIFVWVKQKWFVCVKKIIYLSERKKLFVKNWNYLSEWNQKLFVRVKTIELLGRNWLPSGAPGSPHGCCLPPFVTLFAQIQK